MKRDSFFPLSAGWTLNGRPINVPWPPEARLSNYRGTAGPELDYRVRFTLPEGFWGPGRRLILHFGAVDQTARIFLNGEAAGYHEDGYLPFSLDVTELARNGENELRVLAEDRLDPDFPHGKQSKRPHGMWYTPVSGIWQTVWLEAVPERGAVRSVRAVPDLAGVTLEVDAGGEYEVRVPGAGIAVKSREARLRLDIPSPRLWTPETPFLYDFTVSTDTDRVESYFALRTVEVRKAGDVTRLFLNGKPVFLHAVLDQGYFEDGLFLPREPEEYERDILRMKELGFNALRKHIKIEPGAFYAACDRLGMLVMQDMVSSGEYRYLRDTVLPMLGLKRRDDTKLPVTPRRRELFERHVRLVQERLYGHPCVVGYTVFNEGWGQYDSQRITRECAARDPSRFYVAASGWFKQSARTVQDEHIYFRSLVLRPESPDRLLVLSEFGGLSRRVPGHVREDRKNYGYGSRDTEEALTVGIVKLYREMVLPSIKNGLSAAVYTQLSDVEGETNGLYTYDRQVCKVDKTAMAELSRELMTAFRSAAGE